MAKFKVGDRVYYRDDVNDTGAIVEPAGSDRYWVMWDQSQVRLSALKRNLNLIEEKKLKFEIGDRVKLDYYDDFGTIIGYQDGLWRVKWDNDTEWRFDDALGIVRKANNVSQSPKPSSSTFKVGDRVRYSRGEATGTIVEYKNRAFCKFFVEWDAVNTYGSWLDEDDLVPIKNTDFEVASKHNPEIEDVDDTYTVAEFKKLLDKMDDNLILQMTDLRIGFKN